MNLNEKQETIIQNKRTLRNVLQYHRHSNRSTSTYYFNTMSMLRLGSRLIARGQYRPSVTTATFYKGATRLYSDNPKGNIHDSELKDIISRIKIAPNKRVGESMDKMKSRLIYQSRKRGILETDLLLSAFAAKYLKLMSREQLEEYDNLLYELDWDIYYWATKDYEQSPIPHRWKNSEIMKLLQEFTENKEKEIIRMPELDKF